MPGPAFRRATGVYDVFVCETKARVVEIFGGLDGGGLVNLGSKAEEWSVNEADGFRWHDLYHLSCFAICGWSAVCKSMLGLGEEVAPKSGMMGIRAALLEEAIIARFFAELAREDMTPSEAAVEVGLLAERVSQGTKMGGISAASWTLAFQKGLQLMHQAQRFGGGWLHLDLEKREIEFVR